MQLLWLYYSGKNPRYILCLELARGDGKIYCIEVSKIDHGSRSRIIASHKTLSGLSLDRKVKWLQHNCPAAMTGFKTLIEAKASIANTYPISEANGKNGN